MSATTTASSSEPTGNNTNVQVNQKANVTVATFFSSLIVSVAIFTAQIVVFLIIKGKLPRI